MAPLLVKLALTGFLSHCWPTRSSLACSITLGPSDIVSLLSSISPFRQLQWPNLNSLTISTSTGFLSICWLLGQHWLPLAIPAFTGPIIIHYPLQPLLASSGFAWVNSDNTLLAHLHLTGPLRELWPSLTHLHLTFAGPPLIHSDNTGLYWSTWTPLVHSDNTGLCWPIWTLLIHLDSTALHGPQ